MTKEKEADEGKGIVLRDTLTFRCYRTSLRQQEDYIKEAKGMGDKVTNSAQGISQHTERGAKNRHKNAGGRDADLPWWRMEGSYTSEEICRRTRRVSYAK